MKSSVEVLKYYAAFIMLLSLYTSLNGDYLTLMPVHHILHERLASLTLFP